MNKSNTCMIADTHTYNTTEFILPANCPKQTPDGFSVPGRGGLAALPGDRRGGGQGRGGGGRSGSRLPKAPTWPRGLPVCASLHVSFQWIRVHFHLDGCKRLFPSRKCEKWTRSKSTSRSGVWAGYGGVFILHNNHESLLYGKLFEVVKNIWSVCVCAVGGG